MDDRPWLKHYDPGVPHHIDLPPVPLHRFLEDAARAYPDRPCAIFKGHAVSYSEMNALADHLAARGPNLELNAWEAHTRVANYILQEHFKQSNVTAQQKLVDGNDLIKAFGLVPGPEVGNILEQLREAQAALRPPSRACSSAVPRLGRCRAAAG